MTTELKFQAKLIEAGLLKEVSKDGNISGYSQNCVFEVDERRDEFNKLVQAQQFFPVEYFSKTKADGRFFEKAQVGQYFNVAVWAQGRKYLNAKNETCYFVGLKLTNSRKV